MRHLSSDGILKSLYERGVGGLRDFHISDIDRRRRISLLNTFSKTREAKIEVPMASLIAFSSCASFFRFAISSTTVSTPYKRPKRDHGHGSGRGPLDASAVWSTSATSSSSIPKS